MKKILILICLLLAGCSKNVKKDTIHQLTNQSFRQIESYVLTTKEGECFVFDGGTQEDSKYLIDYIVEHDDNATVDGWFLTHYHDDHTGALAAYLESKEDRVKIKNIYYSFPSFDLVEKYDETRVDAIKRIYYDLDDLGYAHQIHANMEIDFKSLHVKVLNDMQVFENNFGNNTSSVFKVSNDTNSWLVLGDCGEELANYLIQNCKEDIGHIDYLQMAHHGQRGGSKELYHIIDPKVCLWPLTDWIYSNWDGTGDLKFDETIEWIKDIERKDYFAKDGTQSIEFK